MIARQASPDAATRRWHAQAFILHAAVNARWDGDCSMDPELSPLRGAMVLAAGWKEFRRDLIRDLDAFGRTHPDVVGREDWSRVARAVWRRLHARLRAWSLKSFGFALSPRQVIKVYEHYQKTKRLTLENTTFEIRDTDEVDGTRKGWQSSGTERVGTLPEIMRDLPEGVGKDRVVAEVDAAIAEQKQVTSG